MMSPTELLLAPGGESLPSPPVHEIHSVDGWLNVTLNVEAGVWRLPNRGVSFHTRLYNGLAPSPVLHARPGDRVRLLLRNRLGRNIPSPVNDALGRGFRQANTTNLHLHGIHDDAIHDDSFARVGPGEEKLYEYSLDKDSGTTLLYYHPHADGSTALQSFGGMGGALVIEDLKQEAAMALPAEATRTLLLQALQLDPTKPDYVATQLNNGGTSAMDSSLHSVTDAAGCTSACMLMLINGVDGPLRQALPSGGWLRLKLVNAITGQGGMLNLGFEDDSSGGVGGVGGGGDGGGGSGGGGGGGGGGDVGAAPAAADDAEDGAPVAAASACMLSVLAYDGVWLASPRLQQSLVLPPGGRAEVMIGCTHPGAYTFGTLASGGYGGMLGGGHAVAVLDVATAGGEGAADAMAPLPSALPGPPRYYRDLRGGETRPSDQRTIQFSTPLGENVVNGRPYNLSRVDFELELGAVAEWTLESAEAPGTPGKLHPYHQHMTHFQVVAVTDHAPPADDDQALGLTPERFASVGDWRDTLPLYATVGYRIRFVAPFEGRMMVHCHIQKHSDNGMLAIAAISRTRPAGVEAV